MPINDPMAARLREAALRGGPDPRPILSIPELFGEDLSHCPRFIDEVTDALRSLHTGGARASLSAYTEG